MERTITLFDSITSSILNDELSIQEGIIRYIEFLQGVKDDQKSQILGLKNLQKLQKNVGYRANRLKNVLEQMENFEGLFSKILILGFLSEKIEFLVKNIFYTINLNKNIP